MTPSLSLEADTDLMAQLSPQVQAFLHRYSKTLFVQQNLEPEVHLPFFRLPRHRRSLNLDLSNKLEAPNQGYLNTKGAEILSENFASFLQQIDRGGHVQSLTKHFIHVEGKLPGVLTTDEAETEFQVSREVHSAFFKKWGRLAPLPLVISVFKFDERITERYRSSIKPLLSSRSAKKFETLAERGLAALISYQKFSPLRIIEKNLVHLEDWKFLKSDQSSIDEAAERTIQNLTELLAAGFMPATLESQHTGTCVSVQNVSVDGYFHDPDSIVPLASLSHSDFVHGMEFSLTKLQHSISELFQCRSQVSFNSNLSAYIRRTIYENLLKMKSQDQRCLSYFSPSSISEIAQTFFSAQRESNF